VTPAEQIEAGAKALWWQDAKRTWGQDGTTEDGKPVAEEMAIKLWPRLKKGYECKSELVLTAAGIINQGDQ
jgi:hypothetical protein